MHAETFLREFAPLASAPGGVEKLRELVLQLAVQGKLTDTKRPIEFPTLPLSKVVADIRSGNTPSKSEPLFWNGSIPWASVKDLDHKSVTLNYTRDHITREAVELGGAKMASKGELLICTRMGLGKIAILEIDCAFNQDLKAVRLRENIDPLYFVRVFQTIDIVGTGTTVAGISQSTLLGYPIPLPPVAEQQRIVAKVDELMALCDELEAQQKKETTLKRATASSVLNSLAESRTFEETTKNWLQFAPQFFDVFDESETVSELRCVIGDLAANGGLHSQADKSEWKKTSIESLLKSSNSGWSPKCESVPAGKDEWGVLKVSAVTWGEFKPDENKRLPADLEPRPQHAVKAGDVLVSRANTAELVGRAVIAPTDYPRLMISDKLVRLVLSEEVFDKFFLIAFHSSPVRQYFAKVASGTSDSMRNITREQIKRVELVLPPIPEQKRIVRIAEELWHLCDQIEKAISESSTHRSELLAALVENLSETDPSGGGGGDAVSKSSSYDPIQVPESSEVSSDKLSVSNFESKVASQSLPRTHPADVDTKFKEAVLVGAIVKAFFGSGGEPIGNFRLQKAVYFARRHNGEHALDKAFARKAAGPYNPSMKYSGGIAIAKTKNWLLEAKGRFGFGHIPGSAASEADDWIAKYSYADSAKWVCEQFKLRKNEEWETLATVDYAVEHLRSIGIEPDATQVLQYISADDEWRPKIEKLGLTEFTVQSAMIEVAALFGSHAS